MKEVSDQLGEFKKFILRGNVVDLAVGVVIGVAFNDLIKSLVENLINPLIGVIGGQPNFGVLALTINGSTMKFGPVLNVMITFLLTAAVVFFFIVQPINRLMAHVKPSEEIDKPSERNCPACLSAIPAESRRCRFCTTMFDSSGAVLKATK